MNIGGTETEQGDKFVSAATSPLSIRTVQEAGPYKQSFFIRTVREAGPYDIRNAGGTFPQGKAFFGI